MDQDKTDAVRRRVNEAYRLKQAQRYDAARAEIREIRMELMAIRNRWADRGAEHREEGLVLATLASRLAQVQSKLDADATTVAVRIVPPV